MTLAAAVFTFGGRRRALTGWIALALVAVALGASASSGQADAASALSAPEHATAPAPAHGTKPAHAVTVPSVWSTLPFVALLLAIALFPLIPHTAHWWEKNRTKLVVAISLAAITGFYYLMRREGFHAPHHDLPHGWPSLEAVLWDAIAIEYVPFIVLLFSLFTISGGINLRGDLPAHPLTNTAFLACGAVLASFIGTTGAAMLLIRPLLQVNSERRHTVHTVLFFIFLVANIGGSLLPIGDPPLFLGYLQGVPFLWTLNLWKPWLFCVVILLAVYYVWDTLAYRHETARDIYVDETRREPLKILGGINVLFLAGVVLAVALLDPSKPIPGTSWKPFPYMRELVQLALAGLSWRFTSRAVREANKFNFHAIAEVAALFLGIFITMQAPVEILRLQGHELGLTQPWQFFWATGALSSVLDNAPTYVVFFSTACSLDQGTSLLKVSLGQIDESLLVAISCGAVFMGANTYIGNGPNFMVKSIAEQSGVKMPSFFGYMLISGLVLIPLFALVTLLFFAPR